MRSVWELYLPQRGASGSLAEKVFQVAVLLGAAPKDLEPAGTCRRDNWKSLSGPRTPKRGPVAPFDQPVESALAAASQTRVEAKGHRLRDRQLSKIRMLWIDQEIGFAGDQRTRNA